MQSYHPHKSFPTWGRCQAFFLFKCTVILPTRRRCLRFLSLKCMAILPCKSGEGVKLSPLNCIAIPLHKSFPMWQILPHMGKESSFLPPEMQSHPSPHGEGAMLASSKCILLQLLLKMQQYPSPQILSHLYVGNDSSPFKMQNPYKSFPTNSLIYLCFSCYFCLSILYFFFHIYIEFSFSFFPNTWNSSPKWKNYSPVFEANNTKLIEE